MNTVSDHYRSLAVFIQKRKGTYLPTPSPTLNSETSSCVPAAAAGGEVGSWQRSVGAQAHPAQPMCTPMLVYLLMLNNYMILCVD